MRSIVRSLSIAVLLFPCSTVVSQGTFSASAVSGLGIRGTSSTKDPFSPVLMKDDVGKHVSRLKQRPDPRLKAAKSGRVNAHASQAVAWNDKTRRYVFRSEEDRRTEVKRLERESIGVSLPIIWVFSVHEGQVGQLGDPREPPFSDGLAVRPRYEVLQIIDRKTALIRATASRRSASFFLVCDDALPEIQEEQGRYSLPGTYIVEPKQSYKTVAGATRTLPVLREFDLAGVATQH
jgi:hypothetical protein